MFDVRVFFGSTFDVRRSMFDVRVSLPFGEALEVRRSMFDVRVFFGSTFDVRCSMFDVRLFSRSALRLVGVTVVSLAGALEEALAQSNAERLAMGQRCLPPDRFR